MPDEATINQNVEINRLPLRVDRLLKTLAHLHGRSKKDEIREALVEYVRNHEKDIPRLTRSDVGSGGSPRHGNQTSQ